jgi:hypothetical protein
MRPSHLLFTASVLLVLRYALCSIPFCPSSEALLIVKLS